MMGKRLLSGGMGMVLLTILATIQAVNANDSVHATEVALADSPKRIAEAEATAAFWAGTHPEDAGGIAAARSRVEEARAWEVTARQKLSERQGSVVRWFAIAGVCAAVALGLFATWFAMQRR